MKNILKTGIITTLSVVFFGITSQANADLLRECANFLDAQNYQKALQIGLEAVRAEPDNVWSYVCVGISYDYLGHYRQAIKYFKIAEKYAVSKNALAIVYNWEGSVYDNIGDLNNALLYDNRALSLAIELGDRNGESDDLNNIASIYQDMGKLDKALEFYKKSLALSDEKGKSTTYNNIATIYYQMGDYKKAIEYMRKGIEINQRFGDYYDLASDYLNLGSVYIKIKDFSKAKYYLEQGLSMEKKIGNLRWLGAAYRYLGKLYLAEGEKTLAKQNLEKALKYYSLAGDKLHVFVVTKKLNEIK